MGWLEVVFDGLARLGYKPVTQEFAPHASGGIRRMAEDLRQQRYEQLATAFERIDPDRYDEALGAIIMALTGGDEERLPAALDVIRVWHDDAGLASFHAAMLLARGTVKEAWRARGGKVVREVAPDAWPTFFSQLGLADDLLAQATRLKPQHPEPLAWGLITARGLQLGPDELQRRFERLVEVAPLHLSGHLAMLESIKAKWGGSHEAMFAFARQHAERAPEGHEMAGLVVYAHWEMRNLRYWADDERADDYFKQPHVVRELTAAWKRSGGSPQHRPGGDSRVLYNAMAAALALCGQRELARQALQRMKGQCLDWPWCTMADSLPESMNFGWVVDRVSRSVGLRPGKLAA